MKTILRLINASSLIMTLGVFCLSFTGCGGSGNHQNTSPSVSTTPKTGMGRATIAVSWPAKHSSLRARLVPEATKSIIVIIALRSQPLVNQTLTPAQTTYTFDHLPLNSLTATATAYPTSDGSGVPLARGSASFTPKLTDTAPVPIQMSVVEAGQGNSTIIGTITTTDGSPINEARVATTDGSGDLLTTTTGLDGKYSLNAPSGQRVITFSKCGYIVKQSVTVGNNSTATVDAQLPVYTGPDPTSAPVIHVNEPQISQALGQAVVTGQIQQGNSSGGVIIVNGSEAEFAIDGDGRFTYTAILAPGDNVVQVRATNCMGTTLSDAANVTYSPSGNAYFRVTLTWDGQGDVDLHTWDPNLEHSYFSHQVINTGNLDIDNTVSYGPENFTCTALTPGRYRIGVDAYDKSEGRSATVKVSVLSGPNRGQTYFYGPYTFTSTDQDANYPVTGNTSSWWRAVDLVVTADGSITVDDPKSIELPHGLRRGESIEKEHHLKSLTVHP